MPTPDRTSLDEIVQAGRDILEAHGPARLTMQAVAERVGVRPPSLYKRVKSRDDLIGLITEATVRDLGEQLAATGPGIADSTPARAGERTERSGDPREELAEMARAIRAFAHRQPAGFGLIFATRADPARPDTGTLATAVAPVLRVAGALAGPEHALEAARTITAWAYGFISMELAGAFNLGGEVDSAYEFGISALAEALVTRRQHI
jgi:AcrR family transcriptional regulator